MNPLRWSNLKMVGKSLAHYRYYLDHPIAETDAMKIGSRVHDLVLHGDRNLFAIWEHGRRAGKEWDLFKAAHVDATILTAEQEEKSRAIAKSVMSHEALGLIFGCVTEQKREWLVAGRECCGTPDAVGPNSIVDLKVTLDASPDRFPWHAKKMGWLGQLEWYDHGLFAGAADRLTLIAVESTPPYLVQVYHLSADARELGRVTWRSYFERLMVAEAEDRWPGYSEVPVPLEVDTDFSLTIGDEEVSFG